MSAFELVEPRTLEDALDLMDTDEPGVRPFGGGTALMLMMKAQLFKPVRLVSLRRVGGPLFGISAMKDFIRMGAMTTLAQLDQSPLIRLQLPVIGKTMSTLANVRIRNVATLGGGLAHGDPHLDLPPVWAALGARARLVSTRGEREIAAEEMTAGYYETNIQPGEIITHIDVPVRTGWVSAYSKVTTRAAHDWPALGLAMSLRLDGGRVSDLRLFLSAAVDKPTRLVGAEKVLRGALPGPAVFKHAGEAAVAEAGIESDSRGARDYKNQLLRVYLTRGLTDLTGSAP